MRRFTDPEFTDENLWDDPLYEQAELSNKLAPPALRLVHLLADGVAVMIIYYMFTFALYYLAMQMQSLPAVMTWSYFEQVTILAIYFVYCVLMEGFAGGQTLGKLITRYQVVNRNGQPASFKQIILRTLVRFVPFEFLSVIFALSSGMLHDRWSGTRVIKAPDRFLSGENDVILDDRS